MPCIAQKRKNQIYGMKKIIKNRSSTIIKWSEGSWLRADIWSYIHLQSNEIYFFRNLVKYEWKEKCDLKKTLAHIMDWAWAASALMLLSTAHGSNLAAHSLIFCVVVGHEIWPQLPPLVRKDVRKANPMLGDTLCHI